jgi:hypothetical protein
LPHRSHKKSHSFVKFELRSNNMFDPYLIYCVGMIEKSYYEPFKKKVSII